MREKGFSLFILTIFLVMLFCTALAADSIPTAEELLELYPEPEIDLTCDPTTIELLRLVNKKQGLPSSFVPDDLREVAVATKKGRKVQMRDEAATALEKLFAAAKEAGYDLTAVSGYRSYYEQKSIYQNAVDTHGASYASLANAQAGKSEHQLGLAIDISCAAVGNNLNKAFGDTPEGMWVYENCDRFGFIIRYKTEWTKITGYKGEPWHLRYVGVQYAVTVKTMNVPYDTFMQYLTLAWNRQEWVKENE